MDNRTRGEKDTFVNSTTSIRYSTGMKSLHEHLVTLSESPEKTALIGCDSAGKITEEISRAQLLKRVETAATYLTSVGLHAGDRVALEFGNCPELLIISWAAWGMGVVTVPLDTKRDTTELREFKLRTSGAKHVLREGELRSVSGAATQWMPDLSHEALILFTSGTTAHPKGAQLSLQNLIVNAEGIVAWLQIGEKDRFLVELPLHHINSTTFCLASLIAGASIAIPPVYSNSHFFEQAAGTEATFTSVVPSILFDQLSREGEFSAVKDRLKLSRIQIGSAPVVAGDALRFIEKFSVPLYQGYGQTETALRVTGVPMGLPETTYEELVKENSIGEPMSWAHVEIADAHGQILGEKKEGELVVKGSAVMQRYIGDEPAFRDGYFLTGDIGYWREFEGRRFFFLVGRSKEIIIKGGVNISPVAVENALKKISPHIDQVYVVSVNDERYGEEVGAAIVWKEGGDPSRAIRQLKLALLTGHELLSAYETPKYLASINAKDLPTTSTGKVQRTLLKKTLGSSFESVYTLLRSTEFLFTVITAQSPLMKESHALYNHCWQPLNKSAAEYKKYLTEYITLGAVDSHEKLVGQISFSLKEGKLVCVSICSANFKSKPIPELTEIPNTEFVERYVRAGHDPVMNFHTKLGAELVEVIPGGRPEDKSSLGYTMMLRYPSLTEIRFEGSASHQLIQAARMLSNDCGADMYALSRPGGLAFYKSTH